MRENGEERFYEEIEKFIVTRLRAFPNLYSYEPIIQSVMKCSGMHAKDIQGYISRLEI